MFCEYDRARHPETDSAVRQVMKVKQNKRAVSLWTHHVDSLAYLLPVMAIVGLFVAAYLRPIRLIFDNPFSYHFSHGLLILGIIFYMVWSERRLLREIEIRPRIIEGSIITLLGSVILLVGVYSETPVVEGVALIVGVAGLVLLLLGVSCLKVLSIPILYLNFLFPIFDKILSRYSQYFERAGAVLGGYFLTLFGVPHYQHDRYIDLPHTVLKVVQACNGINHIIALIALVMFMGWLRKTRPYRTMIYMLLAAGVGILANGLRIALIGLWTKHFGAESFHGPFDLFYSTFVFMLGFIVLGAVLQYFENNTSGRENMPERNPEHCESMATFFECRKIGNVPMCIAATLLCATWIIPIFVHPSYAAIDWEMEHFPMTIGNMKGRDVDALGEPYERSVEFDSILRRVYLDDKGNSVNFFIGYLNSQKKGKEIHKYPGGLLEDGHAGVEVMESKLGEYRLNLSLYYSDSIRYEAVYFYVVGGKVVNHKYEAKIRTMIEGLFSGKTNAAVVIASCVTSESAGKSNHEKATRILIRSAIPEVLQSISNINGKWDVER